jgi:hypothetical protein
MTTTTVSNYATLLAALKTSKGGDTIALAPGAYPMQTILNVNPQGGVVTITSSDPTQKAILQGLKVATCSNLVFTGLELTTIAANGQPVDPYFAFRVSGLTNVTFENNDIHGDPTLAPGSQTSGFYVNGGQASFVGNSFYDMNAAINVLHADGVNITGNKFYNLSKGGVEMGGTINVTIAKNLFYDFQVSLGTHADGIQLFTAGTTVAGKNISITDNLIYRGNGDGLQGIFIQDEVGTLPYDTVTISGNSVIGGLWNSIYLEHASGPVNILNNYVVSWPGPDLANAASTATNIVTTDCTAWIFTRGDFSQANLMIVGNTAQDYVTGTTGTKWSPPGNATISEAKDQGAEALMTYIKSTF